MLTCFASICKWLFFVSLCCAGYYSNAQLATDFSATPASGCAPLYVRFTDLSTGDPTSWKWDLGNRTISYLKNPAVTYFTPGDYTIKLVIKNASGADSLIKTKYITVYGLPLVNFSASQTTGCYPLPVNFTDMSSAISGNIVKWEWDFGDGTLSEIQNPQHIYKSGGNFNVSLRVTNNFGCVKTVTKLQYIQLNEGVKADFDNNSPNTCKAPVKINFTNKSEGTGNLTYKWDFGDGTVSDSISPSHIYSVNGSYTVKLIVRNSTGCTDTIIKPNAITLGTVNADFSIPPKVCAGAILNLVNKSTPVPGSSFWDFGDGTTSDSLNPEKIYTNPGIYNINMIADFGACIDSISRSITVIAKPVINFDAAQTSSCSVPFTVNFTSNVEGAVSYLWDFGDSTSSSSSTEANPSHTYTQKGVYTVKLIATNSEGCTDTLVKEEFIKIQAGIVTIKDLPIKNCAPFAVTFNAEISVADSIVTYHWDLGDGTTSDLANPTDSFITPGSYNITLITTTKKGCTDTTTVLGGVVASIKPKANFSATPVNTCAFLPINFTDSSTGENIDRWLWIFGDGGKSVLQNPMYQYQDTGYFDVTLTVWSNGCPSTIVFPKYIHISPPIASFIVTNNCITPFVKVFTDKSKGADTWEWDFGDGSTSTIPSPVHTYATTGIYSVKLRVTNRTTGCDYTKTQMVSVIHEKANFTSTINEICKGSTVNFQTKDINSANISYYDWSFGDGVKATTTSGNITHKYASAGMYDVILIITDKLGCKDTLKRSQLIIVNGPTASFKSVTGICLNNRVDFMDSSYSDGTHPIQKWFWKYGDGKTVSYSAPPFEHTYTAAGIYSIQLKVTDSKGCSDSLLRNNYLVVSHPIALFSSQDSFKCPQKPVKFINASTGPNLTYSWDFGDGSISTAINPTHEYQDVGFYTVSLSIKDKYGCTDKIVKSNYINIVVPKAQFLLSDSFSSCPPLVVTFTNTSKNGVSHLWNFGDGNFSSLDTPMHFYSYAGIYNVVLTVTGPGGCTDIATKKITIKGPEGTFTYDNIIGCNPLQSNFVATTKNNSSFIWDFNDGTTVETPDSVISHRYTNAGIYLPKMILVDVNGCKVPIRGLDTIVVYEVTAGISSSSLVLCDSGHVQYTDSSFSNDLVTGYQWDFGDGQTSVDQNPVHTYGRQGKYITTLVVTTQFGCRDTATTTNAVKVISSPRVSIAGGEGGCIPAQVTLQGQLDKSDTSALSWSWTFGNGNTSSQKNPPPQTYAIAGDYTAALTAMNSSGCRDTATKVIKAYPLPQLQTIADTILCKGQSVKLTISGAKDYSWTPSQGLSCSNCAAPVATPASTIQYNVKGASENGCLNKDSVIITVQQPFSMTASRGEDICAGRSVQLSADGAQRYVWTPAAGLDNPTSNRPIATPKETTNYQVVGSDNKGCFRDTAHVPIKVYPVPTVEAGTDTTINVGSSADLSPRLSPDVTAVNWSPTSGVFRNDYPGIVVRPVESTEYTVEVSNAAGCRARDKVTVYVVCNNANVYIPNTFSPNGDGANDIFYPRGSGLFSIRMLRIYNRWGQVVFEKSNIGPNDESQGWDGTFKGQQLPPDVFVYTMDIVCQNNGILTFKGNVALVR